MGQIPPRFDTRLVGGYEILSATGERWTIRTIEVRSGPGVTNAAAREIAAMTVDEIERDEWDRRFERETGQRVAAEQGEP